MQGLVFIGAGLGLKDLRAWGCGSILTLTKPTFLGFLTMISLYKSLKTGRFFRVKVGPIGTKQAVACNPKHAYNPEYSNYMYLLSPCISVARFPGVLGRSLNSNSLA